MEKSELVEKEIAGLRKQRDVLAVFAILLICSSAFAVPRKLASYRELRDVNGHLVDLQALIVANQAATRDIQRQIIATQTELARRIAK
jgi:hypothetical protein